MKSGKILLLFFGLFFLLAICAHAEEAGPVIREATFITDPPGASVYLEVSGTAPYYLGRSNAPIALDFSIFRGTSGFNVRFELPHYNPKTERIPSFYFLSKSRYPEQGSLHLDPKIPILVPLGYFVVNNAAAALVLAAACAALIFGVILPRRRRAFEAIERAARSEAALAQVDTGDPLAGKKLGQYRLVEKLGAGGMGSVYRAIPEDSAGERSVAIKVMNPEVFEDEEFCRRFRREVGITSRLNHPAVLRVLDWGEQDRRLYMIMELIKGSTLKKELVPGGLDLRTFMEIFRPILEGLEFAHEQGVVHRDIKPENIMITENRRLKIMDFGLARGQQYSSITVTGAAMGTPAYMAPEQITGGLQDHRSDQYSLGIMAYEMLAGRRPFEAENTATVIFMHVSEAPPPLGKFRPDLPGQVDAVVMRMIAKNPEERFPDLKAVMNELDLALATETRRVDEKTVL
jgi:hypothetical protein